MNPDYINQEVIHNYYLHQIKYYLFCANCIFREYSGNISLKLLFFYRNGYDSALSVYDEAFVEGYTETHMLREVNRALKLLKEAKIEIQAFH